MTDYAGTAAVGLLAIQQSVLTGNLANLEFQPVAGPIVINASDHIGTMSVGSPTRSHVDYAGLEQTCIGETIFDLVNVLPTQTALGSILAQREWTIEVWNSHRREEKTLASVVISGIGGVQLAGRASGIFGPGESTVYSAVMPKNGSVNVANAITWSFGGETGIVSTITGIRIQVFSPCMDWSEPYNETLEFKTVITKGLDTSEHRMQLRTIPRYELSFRVLSKTNRDALALEALLYGWSHQLYGVPVWPEKTILTADIPIGGTIASGAFTNLPSFEADGLCMVWADQHHFEAFAISTLTASQLTLASAALSAWPAGAWLVPLRRGRLSDEQSLGRPTNWLTANTFTFACEALT